MILLRHKRIRLLLLHLLLQPRNPRLLRRQLRLRRRRRHRHLIRDPLLQRHHLLLQLVPLQRQTLHHRGQPLALIPTPRQLIRLNALCPWPQPDDPAPLPVQLPLKFLLPEIQLHLQLLRRRILRRQLLLHLRDLLPQRCRRLPDLLLQLRLRLHLVRRQHRLPRSRIHHQKLRLKRRIPLHAQLRNVRIHHRNLRLRRRLQRPRLRPRRRNVHLPLLLNHRRHRVPKQQQRQRMRNRQSHQCRHHNPQPKLRRLAHKRLVSPIRRQQRPVHRQNDERPHQRNRHDVPPVVRQSRHRIGRRNQSKQRRHQHRRPKRHILPPLPSRTLTQTLLTGARQPVKNAGKHTFRFHSEARE